MLEHIGHPTVTDDEPHAIEMGLRAALVRETVEEFDLVSGLVGVGLYGLERGSRGLGREIVSSVLDALESRAKAPRAGTAWFRPPAQLEDVQRDAYPNGLFDVGVAHGTSGVIGFLSVAARRERYPRALELLESAVSWLLDTRAHTRGEGMFPNFINGETAHASLPAWRYGDLGIAAVLSTAGRACERDDWRTLATQTALDALERCESTDACLCHGATGFALIARCFYRTTQDERFLKHVQSNVETALSFFDPGIGPYGFRSAHARQEGEHQR